MSAQIVHLNDDMMFVPGTDPARILEEATGELDTGQVVLTPLEDVEIGWHRVNPCHPNSCDDGGGHNAHWQPTPGKTRGGFQGALLEIGWDDQ
jgi:hypothetical protein